MYKYNTYNIMYLYINESQAIVYYLGLAVDDGLQVRRHLHMMCMWLTLTF